MRLPVCKTSFLGTKKIETIKFHIDLIPMTRCSDFCSWNNGFFFSVVYNINLRQTRVFNDGKNFEFFLKFQNFRQNFKSGFSNGLINLAVLFSPIISCQILRAIRV